MKKYLREIEISGIALIIIGCIISLTSGYQYGVWPCGTGILLMVIQMVYKSYHWKEYERENKQNIAIILATIMLIWIQIMRAR